MAERGDRGPGEESQGLHAWSASGQWQPIYLSSITISLLFSHVSFINTYKHVKDALYVISWFLYCLGFLSIEQILFVIYLSIYLSYYTSKFPSLDQSNKWWNKIFKYFNWMTCKVLSAGGFVTHCQQWRRFVQWSHHHVFY